MYIIVCIYIIIIYTYHIYIYTIDMWIQVSIGTVGTGRSSDHIWTPKIPIDFDGQIPWFEMGLSRRKTWAWIPVDISGAMSSII